MKKQITVIGSGYVGTTTSALLATSGYSVTALDIDPQKVATINSGKSPFFERGLNELITYGISKKTLSATSNTDNLKEADIIFSCVGTPDNPDGSPNLKYIKDVARLVAQYAKPGAVFVQKSTVPVGTGQKLKEVLKDQIYVSNPEFLREGSAILDSILYDRIVIGCEDPVAAKQVEVLFHTIHKNSEKILKVCDMPFPGNIPKAGKTLTVSINSAELIKVTANAFLALKISFANSIAQLADKTDADITEVMDGIGLDTRIGRSFLNASRGYGGGCFPKDVSGLISTAVDHGVNLGIMHAATEVNTAMPGYILHKLQSKTEIEGKKIAVLGLAFKSGTSDTRKSPAIEIANRLTDMGALVTAYDPQANDEAKPDLNPKIIIAPSFKQALNGSVVTIIATDWPEFANASPQFYSDNMSGKLIVDAMNCLNKTDIQNAGLTYIGVGR